MSAWGLIIILASLAATIVGRHCDIKLDMLSENTAAVWIALVVVGYVIGLAMVILGAWQG